MYVEMRFYYDNIYVLKVIRSQINYMTL